MNKSINVTGFAKTRHNVAQRPSCPDMYTVAVFVLYSTHSSSFSVPVDGMMI